MVARAATAAAAIVADAATAGANPRVSLPWTCSMMRGRSPPAAGRSTARPVTQSAWFGAPTRMRVAGCF